WARARRLSRCSERRGERSVERGCKEPSERSRLFPGPLPDIASFRRSRGIIDDFLDVACSERLLGGTRGAVEPRRDEGRNEPREATWMHEQKPLVRRPRGA